MYVNISDPNMLGLDLKIEDGRVKASATHLTLDMDAHDLVSEIADEDQTELLAVLLNHLTVEEIETVFNEVSENSNLILTVEETD